jgi:predicted ribonuclease YlaK
MEYQGVTAQNIGQVHALKMLTSSKDYAFLTGPAGTGKTLLTGAVGLEQVIKHPKDGFKKVIYTRLQIQMGMEVGHLPGDLIDGKTEPFLEGFKDNFKEMDYSLPFEHLINKKLEFAPIQTMRGRTIPNAFIIVDEAQNLDIETITSIATRLGMGSKMIFMGNFSQIDDKKGFLKKPENNGFYELLRRFYETNGHRYFEHVHLTEIQRSGGAAYVEKMMRNHKLDPRFVELEERGIAMEEVLSA